MSTRKAKIVESRVSTPVMALLVSCLIGHSAFARTPSAFGLDPYLLYTLGQYELADAVSIGDVTGDGRQDAVVTVRSYRAPGDTDDFLEDYNVLVYAQDEHGNLTTPIRYNYQSGAMRTGLSLGDMNNDGILDIVVGHNHGITILLADGCGRFKARKFDSTIPAEDVGLIDVDRDGNLDVVGQSWSDGATIFYGDGSGSIRDSSHLATSAAGYNTLKVGDVTGDGLPDVVLTSGQGAISFWVYAGRPQGGLVLTEYKTTGGSWGIGIGDLNHDGRQDIALTHIFPARQISIYTQSSSGIMSHAGDLDTYKEPEPILAIDLDNDGKDDLVTLYGGWNSMGLYFQTSTGFSTESLVPLTGAITSHFQSDGLAGGDLNGDGCTDIAIADMGGSFGPSGLVVFHGKGCVSVAAGPDFGSAPACASKRKGQDLARDFAGDFDGDGRSDVLWRNESTGANAIWKGGNYQTPQSMVSVTNLPWQIVGVGDFDGDGKSDVLWRNDSTGANTIWRSANASMPQSMPAVTNLSWKIVGIGDVDGDGRSDVLWRNEGTGANAIWKGGNYQTPQSMVSVTNLSWQIVGVGDFDGDGKSDVLWRNDSTGANTIWRSADASTPQSMPAVTNLSWKIVGIGDVDGDGRSDVLWRNEGTGANAIWKGGNYQTSQSMVSVTNLSWQIVGVGDFDGDGKSDVLWRNDSTGANTIWRSADASMPQSMPAVTNLSWKVMPRRY